MLKAFNANEKLYDDFAVLCRKERVKLGAKINDLIAEYVKEHGDKSDIIQQCI